MIKLITHTDLDGVGCAILTKLTFIDADISFTDYNNINEEVEKTITNHEQYEQVFITDISFDENIAEKINSNPVLKQKFVLIDHHQTALSLTKYDWCFIELPPHSGTSLLYKYLLDNKYLYENNVITDFVELVRQYDVWEWKGKNNVRAKELNMLLFIYGRDFFIDRAINNITSSVNGNYEFSTVDKQLLQIEYSKIQSYVQTKEERMSVVEFEGYRVAVVFAEQYIGDLSEHILNKYENIDILMVIQPDKAVSLRTKRNNINLGVLAKKFGGGGHPQAAGITVTPDMTNNIVQFILQNLK